MVAKNQKLLASLTNGELRVTTHGPQRMATQWRTRVDGKATISSSLTCPRTMRAQPLIHQQRTRCNIPFTKHTTTDPPPNGKAQSRPNKPMWAALGLNQVTAQDRPKELTWTALGPNPKGRQLCQDVQLNLRQDRLVCP